MTPLPKKRHSTRRQGKRRAAISLKLKKLVVCTNCKKQIPSHTVCAYCGHYKGKDENKKRSAAQEAKSNR